MVDKKLISTREAAENLQVNNHRFVEQFMEALDMHTDFVRQMLGSALKQAAVHNLYRLIPYLQRLNAELAQQSGELYRAISHLIGEELETQKLTQDKALGGGI